MIPSGVCAMEMADRLLSKLKSYNKNEDGAFSIMWGVSLIVMVGAVGMGVDYAVATSSFAKAQTLADTTALAAAINVRDNGGEIPTNQSEGLFGDYTAAQLGYKFSNSVINGAAGVSVNVSYDAVKREAHVTLNGATRPFFMQAFGYNDFKFDGASVVKFEEKEPLEPASIVLVLDNSGSMAFDDKPLHNGNPPFDATRRMEGLIASAKNFMIKLDEEVGPQVEGEDELFLRTGMLAFDKEIIEDRVVPMEWGTQWATGPEDKLEDMNPLTATDSSLPLERALEWLTGDGTEDEPAVHERVNENANPLKYVILMTDGKNSEGDEQWVAREGTQQWRRITHIPEKTEREIVNAFIPDAQCRIENGYERQYYEYRYSNGTLFRGNTRQRVTCNVTTPAITEEDFRFQTDEPNEAGDWEEGEIDIQSNIDTREQCDKLHDEDVEVFTIGFALTPGQFETNEWGNRTGAFTPFPPNVPTNGFDAYTFEESLKDTNIAKGLLQYCASSDKNFITAEDTEALQEAFKKIGETIVKEVIRIDS